MTFSFSQPSQTFLLYALVASTVFFFACLALRQWFSAPSQALDDSKPAQPATPDPKPLSPQSTHQTDIKTEDCEEEEEIEMIKEPAIDRTFVKQTYEAFLVLDVEATCMPGTDFNYPNEIIVSPS